MTRAELERALYTHMADEGMDKEAARAYIDRMQDAAEDAFEAFTEEGSE